VISTFGHLLFVLLYLEMHADLEGVGARGRHAGEQLLMFINDQGPRLWLAVPPVILKPLCGLFLRPHYLQSWHLLLVFRGLWQFVVLMPTLAVASLWCALVEEHEDKYAQTQRALLVLGKLSTMLALYCLFVLYSATHDMLKHLRTTAKFVSIKLFLFVALLQEPLFDRFVEQREQAEFMEPAPFFLGSAGGHAHKPACLHGSSLRHFWSMYALALESIGMALLLRLAFPASELSDDPLESGALTVELELMRHRVERRRSWAKPPAQSLDAYISLGGTARASPPAEAGENGEMEMNAIASRGDSRSSGLEGNKM
jgi:hypothetical protein